MVAEDQERAGALDGVLELGAAWTAVMRVLEGALQGADISLSQAMALRAIAAAAQPFLLSDLAAQLTQQPQSVTSLMDRLEHGGWARRVQDLADRRAIRVEPTEAGRAKAGEVEQLLETAAEKILASLGVRQRGGLHKDASALYEACRKQAGIRLPERLARGQHA